MRKKSLETQAQALDRVQAVFNKYIRLRDQHLPCVSCGRWHQGKWNAGHFLSRGSHPELRFSEDNVHRQCEPCNSHLSGNSIPFREELIRRIGEDRVLALEGPHPPAKYTAQELDELKKEYLSKIKEIESYFPDYKGF